MCLGHARPSLENLRCFCQRTQKLRGLRLHASLLSLAACDLSKDATFSQPPRSRLPLVSGQCQTTPSGPSPKPGSAVSTGPAEIACHLTIKPVVKNLRSWHVLCAFVERLPPLPSTVQGCTPCTPFPCNQCSSQRRAKQNLHHTTLHGVRNRAVQTARCADCLLTKRKPAKLFRD